jgi:CHAD domain-containing protein
MKGKRISGLEASAPADEMIQLALRTQLKAMCAMRKQALNWNDPEGVHDMRVLSRRLRSAIADFEPYLRKPPPPTTKLRTIAKSLGAVRDEDVAIPALAKLQADAHGAVAEGIEVLTEERREQRAEARAMLEKAIRRSDVKEFREEFENKIDNIRVALKKSTTRRSLAGDPTFGEVGARVIAARLKELRAASSHIFFPFEVKEIHELRILAKRLRYALELFEPCWGEDIKHIAKEIALLQTSLGELHDCDVWIEDLGTRLKKTTRQDRIDPEVARASAACTWLLKHFAKERMEHYRDSLGRWQQWEADGFLNHLRIVMNRV